MTLPEAFNRELITKASHSMIPQRRGRVLIIICAMIIAIGSGMAILFQRSDPVEDPLSLKYAGQTGSFHDFPVFHLTSKDDRAIFLISVDVQVPAGTGWQTGTNFWWGEIRRMKAGKPEKIEVFELPSKGLRARICFHYARQMGKARELRFQIAEAWKLKSFTNWSGKAWGGGRFDGDYRLFSDEIKWGK